MGSKQKLPSAVPAISIIVYETRSADAASPEVSSVALDQSERGASPPHLVLAWPVGGVRPDAVHGAMGVHHDPRRLCSVLIRRPEVALQPVVHPSDVTGREVLRPIESLAVVRHKVHGPHV